MSREQGDGGRNPLRVIRRRTPDTGPMPVPRYDPATVRVAAVIPAKDEEDRIAATVRAVRAIPHVDLVLVVDDGSEDDTQHLARRAGAVVVRHSVNRGKASAMETGASVVAMRDAEDLPPRLLLFVDADLGATAVNAAPLVPPVLAGKADMSIAVLPKQPGAGGRGLVTGLARRSIHKATGWAPTQPLSGQRCLTRAAFDSATPLAHGWGVETGMTMDVLKQGFAVVEVPCDLSHRASGSDMAGQLHRAAQYRDVLMAVAARRFRHYKHKIARDAEIEDDGAAQGAESAPPERGSPGAEFAPPERGSPGAEFAPPERGTPGGEDGPSHPDPDGSPAERGSTDADQDSSRSDAD